MARSTTNPQPLEIIIVGGGIGGLTAAAALSRAGHDVHVYERAARLRADGAGLTVQLNAMKALRALGIAEAVNDAGATFAIAKVRDERGKIIQETHFDEVASTYGEASVAIHRARLLHILAELNRETGVHLHTGKALAGLDLSPDSVRATFDDETTHVADLVIGCDGLWSTTREALFGHEPPRYAGYTCWRGLAPTCLGQEMSETWGPGSRFGIVPIADDETYWFAVADSPAGGIDEDDPRPTLRQIFEGWPADVATLLDATPPEAILRNDIFDRPPTQTWGRGRVTLLGDAAHPMTPNMGQGACQAIEDAMALANALAGAPTHDVESRLRAYESARMPRANWFVRQSWQFGRAAHMFPKATPLRRLRDIMVGWTPESAMKKTFDRMYGVEFN